MINTGTGLDIVQLGQGKATMVLSVGDGYDLIKNLTLDSTQLKVTSTDGLSFVDSAEGA